MSALTEILFADKQNYHGSIDQRFHDLAEQFSRLQDARTEQGGAALAVYFRGQKVVDIYTGKNLRLNNGMKRRFLFVTQLEKVY